MSDTIHEPQLLLNTSERTEHDAAHAALERELARPLPLALALLSGPIIASMVSRTAMQWVDFVMVATLGTEAQAAIVPAGITLFVVIAFGMGVMAAVNTLVAQHFGRGTAEGRAACAVATWQGLWVSLGLAALSLPLWFVLPWVFTAAGHEPAVAQLESSYVQIGLLGIFPTVASVAVANFFNGIHRPMIGLWATVAANAFNVVANFALIFGMWGFPELGMDGAAYATMLAAWLNLLVLATWWLRASLRQAFGLLRHIRPNRAMLKQVLKIGLPSGLQFTADIATFAVFTVWVVGRLGTIELAAHNVALKFLELSLIPCVGMAVAVSAAAGRSIGQGRLDRAHRFAHWGMGLSAVFLTVMVGVFLLGGRALVPWLSEDPQVTHRAMQLVLILCVCHYFDCAQIMYGSALRGAGDTVVPAIATAVTAVTLMLGGGYLLVELWPAGGARGPWLGLFAYVAVLATYLFVRFQRGGWKRIQLIHD
ncbi:MAG: MATE family efflux transporter [Planctomycetota bacterium]